MIVAVHQPNFMPWLGFFAKINAADTFILLDSVSFPKNAWVNRVKIAGNGEPIWLTIPVKKQPLGSSIQETLISYDRNWPKRLSTTLIQRYGKRPYFDEIFPQLEPTWSDSPTRLVDLNIPIIRNLCRILGLKKPTRLSSEFEVSESSSARLAKLCQLVGGSAYIAGKDSVNYEDEETYRDANISYSRKSYHSPTYEQRSLPFISGLSAIDALFNIGSEATRKLLVLE